MSLRGVEEPYGGEMNTCEEQVNKAGLNRPNKLTEAKAAWW